MTEDRPNWRYIGRGFYIVRTQAGFNQALKHFSDRGKEGVQGYPTKYPALIALSEGYSGGLWTRVQAFPITKLIEELSKE